MTQNSSPINSAFRSLQGGFLAIGLFSLALNIMMLAGPLYMLQIYDRVLTSSSMETLIALSVLLGGIFIASGILDYIRSKILNKLGASFELNAGVPILEAAIRRKVSGNAITGDNISSDLNSFRDFISGNTLIAFFDSPWVPIYLVILFLLHPYIGFLGLTGAVILGALALINNYASNKPMQNISVSSQQANGFFETCERNAEIIHSMGMGSDLRERWVSYQKEKSKFKIKAIDRNASFSVFSKTFRMALQSAMLGLGAALAISGESSPGVMIASTIILGRALAPIDQAIGQWRTYIAAKASYSNLKNIILENPEKENRMAMPKAKNSVQVSIKQAAPPASKSATLSSIKFDAVAGDVIAVIGHSGSGKSTLARMLAGIWTPQKGDVMIDGTSTDKWNFDELGKQIGYLSQNIELFEGTIKENISRFSSDADDATILRAARDADVHEMILQMPDGYETKIGNDGIFLSGGQRQRIGLARALYNNPFILVLDEPNSNLDATGDSALRRAVQTAQERGAIIFVMTHRPSTLQTVNKVLVLNEGKQKAFGPKAEVLRTTTRAVPTPTTNTIAPSNTIAELKERAV